MPVIITAAKNPLLGEILILLPLFFVPTRVEQTVYIYHRSEIRNSSRDYSGQGHQSQIMEFWESDELNIQELGWLEAPSLL